MVASLMMVACSDLSAKGPLKVDSWTGGTAGSSKVSYDLGIRASWEKRRAGRPGLSLGWAVSKPRFLRVDVQSSVISYAVMRRDNTEWPFGTDWYRG